MTAHPSIDQKELTRQTRLHPDRWKKAWDYLYNTDFSQLAPGRYEIDGGNVYALVTEGPLKASSENRWESHRHYADIHYIISGKEEIGAGALGNAQPVVPYDTAKDIAFYHVAGKFYPSDGSQYFVFFPQRDAHQPGVNAGNAIPGEVVKRLVIKVLTE